MTKIQKNTIGVLILLVVVGFIVEFIIKPVHAFEIYNDTGYVVHLHHVHGTNKKIATHQRMSWGQSKGSKDSFSDIYLSKDHGRKLCKLRGTYSLEKGEYMKLKLNGHDSCSNDVCLRIYDNHGKEVAHTVCEFVDNGPEPSIE